MSDGTIRVGICDDSEAVRDGMAIYLSIDPGLLVAATYVSGAEAINGVKRDRIGVLLLDVRMPGMMGPAVALKLATDPEIFCKVIYLTSYPDEVPIAGELRRTVLGALAKDVTPEDLVSAIRLVASGIALFGPEFRFGRSTAREPWVADDREMVVLDLVRTGATNARIGEELGLSSSRVKQIVSQMCRRIGVRTRTELAMYSGPSVARVGRGQRD
ncbi:MAG: response regulator transcription factor [Acidipropionibacterium sp.]|jgi:DNA-binding NarL/FixJ family response regulator|nr:response regulator transcription factor [Acidipropionibacterium sp.]